MRKMIDGLGSAASAPVQVLGEPKAIIGVQILQRFQTSRKTPASPCQYGNIMTQIDVNPLDCESVVFVVNIVLFSSFLSAPFCSEEFYSSTSIYYFFPLGSLPQPTKGVM